MPTATRVRGSPGSRTVLGGDRQPLIRRPGGPAGSVTAAGAHEGSDGVSVAVPGYEQGGRGAGMSTRARGLLAVPAATLLVLGIRDVAAGGVFGRAVLVGAALIVLLIGAGTAWCLERRRRRQEPPGPT